MPKPRRDWSDARAKVEREGCCRNCGSTHRVEAAHTGGREFDQPRLELHCSCGALLPPEPDAETFFEHSGHTITVVESTVLWVNPDDIVPLCGPATDSDTCHGRYDAHKLDLLPYMRPEEQTRLVRVYRNIAVAFQRAAGYPQPPRPASGLDRF